MASPEPSPPPRPRLRLLLGVALATGLAAALMLLQHGGWLMALGRRPGTAHWVVLGSFGLGWALLVGPGARRAAERPLRLLLLGLLPLGLGGLAAGLTSGNLPQVDELRGHCDLLLAVSFEAGRLWMLGLLGTGALWLGCVPSLAARLPSGPARPSGALRGRWVMPALAALWALAVLLAFLDPLMPERGAVGGAAERGLWALALGLPALLAVGHGLRRASGPLASGAAAALGLAASGGLLLLALAGWVGGLLLGLGIPAFDWPGASFESSLVLATGLRSLGPALACGALLAAGCGLLGASRQNRRELLGLLGALAVVAALGASALSEQGAQFTERCQGLKLPGLHLPEARAGAVREPPDGPLGPTLWLTPGGAMLDDEFLPPGEARLPAAPAPGLRLRLALDRDAPLGRLGQWLVAAREAGYPRAGLVLLPAPPDEGRCALERRVFGLCLSARVAEFWLLPLELQGPPAALRLRLGPGGAELELGDLFRLRLPDPAPAWPAGARLELLLAAPEMKLGAFVRWLSALRGEERGRLELLLRP
jgi:hypothetical protein